MTKLPPWLSAGQTIAWIAFGKATPAAEWADLPELQETRPWRAPRDLLLLALQARAAGEKWRLPARHDGYWSKEEVDQQVDRLMRQTGLSAAALAEELQADIARVGDGVARIGDAEARLAAAKADLRG